MRRNINGFTLVELLIVIVVLAVLATISVVAYNGVQDRARTAALQNDLSNARKQMELAYALGGSYPASLPADTAASSGNVLQLTQSSSPDSSFCINGYGPANLQMSISSQDGFRDYLCLGVGIGSPVGGDLPAVPPGTNLVSDFSTWQLTGGVSYDISSGELRLSSSAGSATSPLIRIDGASQVRLTVEAYATQPSPIATPNSNTHFSSLYFAADGVTPVQNTTGHTGNGNAQTLPLNNWRPITWNTAAGPNVRYVKFRIQSTPTSYTSDNRYRNPQILVP